jgi:hypothetical protein
MLTAAQKARKAARDKAFREGPRRCECSRPGTVKSHGGKICERCARLEYQRDLRSSWKELHAPLFGGLSEFSFATDHRTPARFGDDCFAAVFDL